MLPTLTALWVVTQLLDKVSKPLLPLCPPFMIQTTTCLSSALFLHASTPQIRRTAAGSGHRPLADARGEAGVQTTPPLQSLCDIYGHIPEFKTAYVISNGLPRLCPCIYLPGSWCGGF